MVAGVLAGLPATRAEYAVLERCNRFLSLLSYLFLGIRSIEQKRSAFAPISPLSILVEHTLDQAFGPSGPFNSHARVFLPKRLWAHIYNTDDEDNSRASGEVEAQGAGRFCCFG